MTKPKSTSDRLAKVDQTIERNKEERKRLLQKLKEEESKARTHRLIEYGAIVQSCFRWQDLALDPVDFQSAIQSVKNFLDVTGTAYDVERAAFLFERLALPVCCVTARYQRCLVGCHFFFCTHKRRARLPYNKALLPVPYSLRRHSRATCGVAPCALRGFKMKNHVVIFLYGSYRFYGYKKKERRSAFGNLPSQLFDCPEFQGTIGSSEGCLLFG